LEGELLSVPYGGDGSNLPRSDRTLQYFAPLLVIQLPQFQLRIGKGGSKWLRLMDSARPSALAVVAAGVAG
jgi:hypothetical protein